MSEGAWYLAFVTHLELLATRHHSLEAHADTLDNCQQHGATDSTVANLLGTSSYGQRTSCEETSDDGVPGVLLLADALNCAIECAEETTPHTEVTTKYGRAHLDCCDGTNPSLAVGAVSEALDTVPYCAADSLQNVMLVCAQVLRPDGR